MFPRSWVAFLLFLNYLLVVGGGYMNAPGEPRYAINNSEEYIKAIAAVLERANCPDFLVSTIGKAEQLKLQKSLGLGNTPVAPETVLAVWQERTGKPAKKLAEIFQQQALITQNKPPTSAIKSKAILDLLEKWRQLH